MDPVVTSGVISAGSNVVGSAGNFLSELFFGNRNEQWARQDATTAFNRQQQLLAEQRAYESPAAQMRRYVEAGLNPNLIYGQQPGSISAPSVPQASSYAGSAQPFSPGMMDSILDARLKQAQIKDLESQAGNRDKLTDAQIKELISRAGLQDVSVEKVRADVDLAKANFDKVYAEIAVLNQDEIAKMLDNEFNKATFDDRVGEIANKYKMSTIDAEKHARLVEASIKQYLGAADASRASAALSRAQIPLQNALVQYYKSLENKAGVESAYIEVQRQLKDYYGDMEIVAQIDKDLADGDLKNILIKRGMSKNQRNPRSERKKEFQ